MTSDDALRLYNEMISEFGNRLPNPEHYPKQFQYYVKLYLHYKKHSQKNEGNNR